MRVSDQQWERTFRVIENAKCDTYISVLEIELLPRDSSNHRCVHMDNNILEILVLEGNTLLDLSIQYLLGFPPSNLSKQCFSEIVMSVS